MAPLFVLGGAQTDFARNFAREGSSLFDVMRATTAAALTDTGLAWADVETVHVGNFTAELFAHQGQLGGFFPSMHEDLVGVPSARHEAACASGSVALLAACAELQAGHYDVALVLGVEQMRNVDGATAAAHLGVAAFHGREAQDARFVWPTLFAEVARFYAQRFGVGPEAGLAWSARMFENAARNPLAQTRAWAFPEGSFELDDVLNPLVEAPLRRFDCGQITDGAAALVLVSERFLARLGVRDSFAVLRGFGHRTAPMSLPRSWAARPARACPFRRSPARWRRHGSAPGGTRSRPWTWWSCTTASASPPSCCCITWAWVPPRSWADGSPMDNSVARGSVWSIRAAGSSGSATPWGPPGCAWCWTPPAK